MATKTDYAGSGALSASTDDIDLPKGVSMLVITPDENNGSALNIGCELMWGAGVTYPAAAGEKVILTSSSNRLTAATINGTGNYRYRVVGPAQAEQN